MTVIYILALFVLVLLVLYLLAPANYDVSRTVTIALPSERVYEYLKYLKNQDQWSPWSQKDPDMQKGFRGTDGTVGAVSSWDGNN